MNKYYTRTGDDGYTGLLGGGRVSKHHPIPDAIGTIDEASATLGFVRSQIKSTETAALILEVQRDLYHIMAEIAASPENVKRFRTIDDSRVNWLEDMIDMLGKQVEYPGEFIVPGDTPTSAAIAVARTVVRRAERKVSALSDEGQIENTSLLQYLNRLSSLCFALEMIEIESSRSEGPTFARQEST